MEKELELVVEIAEPGAKKMFEFSLADSDLETHDIIETLIKKGSLSYEQAKKIESNKTNLDRCRGIEHLQHHSGMKLYDVAIIKGAPKNPIQTDMMDRFYGILKGGGHVVIELDMQIYKASEPLRKQYSASFLRIIERFIGECYHRWNARRKYRCILKKSGFGNFKNNHSLLIAQKN